MDLKELVIAFNRIPRSHMTSNGRVKNHWHFTVRKVPAGDVLHIVNPDSRATHTEGPTNILSSESITVQAEVVLHLLLKAFVQSICAGFTPPIAPWSWGTPDEDLAKTLGARMSAANIRKGLCRISFGDKEHIKIENEVWLEEVERLDKAAKTTCRKCKRGPKNSQKLLRCGGCKQVQYCSKECQREDWKGHKKYCQILRIATTEDWSGVKGTHDALDGLTYHIRYSSNLPEIQALGSTIGLKIPARSLGMLMRRLIITGNDTPENFLQLFGLSPTDQAQIEKLQDDFRMEILLGEPKGSYNYAMSNSHGMDEKCPPWRPRKASDEEKEEIQAIRQMQKVIRRHMGSRNMRSIDNEDMEDILMKEFGIDDWKFGQECYFAALNSMDIGYPEGYNPCRHRNEPGRRQHHVNEYCSDA